MKLLRQCMWILSKPSYYRDFIAKIWNRMESIGGDPGRDVRDRLRAIAIDESEIMMSLKITPVNCFDELYSEEIEDANQRIAACGETLGGAGALNLLFQLTRATKAHRILETGVAYGWSTFALLAASEFVPQSRVASTDFPQLGTTGANVGLAIPKRLQNRWRLFVGSDRTQLPRAIVDLGEIDLCHYDSDKSYKGRMFAYPLIWEALRPRGVFVSDDIGDNRAFEEFCFSMSAKPLILSIAGKYVGVIQKP